MKTVLVTGASGFLGGYAAKRFGESGWNVVGLDAAPPRADFVHEFRKVTLPDPSLSGILKKISPDLCVHAAGPAQPGLSVHDPAADFRGSVVVTFNLLEALRASAPQCRFVYYSSAAVYGEPEALPVAEDAPASPISPYGWHKLQCEELCAEYARVYGLRTAALRIFSAYGAGLRRQVIWDICRKASGDAPFVLQGTGAETRDFVHASDVARAAETAALKAPMSGEVYNVASGRSIRIDALARTIAAALGSPREARFDGAVPAGVPRYWQADVARIAALGFEASVPFEPSVRETAAWCAAETAAV